MAKQDLQKFIKTKLAQEIQKSQIGGFMKKVGAPPMIAKVTSTKLGDSVKTADGIDMGQQVDAGVIPIIYGHVGMSNTQFDLGQKPSDVDAEFVTQEVRLPISEGPIEGLAKRQHVSNILVVSPDNHYLQAKNVLINDDFIIDPVTEAVNVKDVKFEVTFGDGTTNKQSYTVTDTSPITGEEVEAIDDPTNDKLLNDLGDVTAATGERYVLYWNNSTGQWEAKSFNSLLNEAGATYDGGAGGSGGTGGEGGTGGVGGVGGVGPADGQGQVYTQWNPPPAHVETTGTIETTTTVTEPTELGTALVTGKGAPLRRVDQATPYFTTDIDFADVDETTDTIDITTFFPDGIYKEITTVSTVKDGTITLCGTERPIADSGNLNCLTPNVSVSEDGQSSTTTTRANGNVTVNYVLTTQICGREFVLHEGSHQVSYLKNGGYKHTQALSISSMNAGSGTLEDGTQQIGAIEGTADCNSTDLKTFNFKDWDLSDYITAYPNQILSASNTVKVYAWINNKTADEFTISTNTFLHAVEVVKPLSDYDQKQSAGQLNTSSYSLHEPDHGFQPFISDTETDGYALSEDRKYTDVITGSFGTDSGPDPLLVFDYASSGSLGGAGVYGGVGTEGAGGESGTSGSVTVPATPNVPTAQMSKDTSYSGDGVAHTITLPQITVANADADAINDLTIRVPSGSISYVNLPGSVSAINNGTSALTLTGTVSNLQACLDANIRYTSTTATRGDITITFYISSPEGNSETTRQIRSQAQTEYTAPTFTITVNDYNGSFDAYVRGKAIMNSVTGATSNNATATAIASAITSYTSIPNWTASASGAVVTVTGPQSLGARYNGIRPTSTGDMDTSITDIEGGITPSRVSQPKPVTTNLKSKFIPALAFTNTLSASDVAWAQVAYRPKQGDGTADLSEVGFYIGGRKIEAPNWNGINFTDWVAADYSSELIWNNNPAWVFWDYLTNTTFGLGTDLVMDAGQKYELAKDVYKASNWCDHRPSGGDEIASINGIVYGAESKYEMLQKICDLFQAKFVFLNGNPRLFYDLQSYQYPGSLAPSVKKIVTQANSVDMSYQSGSVDNIFNVINIKWNNPDNYYRLEDLQYKNTTSIQKYGERETSIELFGCSSKQQALWYAAWMYETEAVNAETVSYIAGWDHFDVLPGDTIIVKDTFRPGVSEIGGRVDEVNPDGTLVLDRDTGLSGSNIAVVDTNGVIRYGTVSGQVATISGTFDENAVWAVHSAQTATHRVVAIEESEEGVYAVTAQKHDPDKYTRIWANTV